MKRVMVVDDHALVRAGVQRLFARCTDLVIACEAGSGQEAIELFMSPAIDAVLLDLSLPDLSGMAVLRLMRAARPDLPILIFSVFPEEQFAVDALKAGASGYIEKSRASDEIVRAMRMVLSGKTYVSLAISRQPPRASADDGHQRLLHDALSTRELQVFHMLAKGLTVASISEDLALSVRTVSTHRARILDKLNVKTDAALTYYALKNALIE